MFETVYQGFTIKIEHDRGSDTYDLLVFRAGDLVESDTYSSMGWNSKELALKKAKAYIAHIKAKAKFYGVTNA